MGGARLQGLVLRTPPPQVPGLTRAWSRFSRPPLRVPPHCRTTTRVPPPHSRPTSRASLHPPLARTASVLLPRVTVVFHSIDFPLSLSITHSFPFHPTFTQRPTPSAGYAHLTRFARPGISHTADADPPQHILDAQGHADELPAAMQFNAVDEEFDFVAPPGIMEPPVIQPKLPTWDTVETPVRFLASATPQLLLLLPRPRSPQSHTCFCPTHTHTYGPERSPPVLCLVPKGRLQGLAPHH